MLWTTTLRERLGAASSSAVREELECQPVPKKSEWILRGFAIHAASPMVHLLVAMKLVRLLAAIRILQLLAADPLGSAVEF
eukprot:3195985-Prorocentrum_lima.AAC.1